MLNDSISTTLIHDTDNAEGSFKTPKIYGMEHLTRELACSSGNSVVTTVLRIYITIS